MNVGRRVALVLCVVLCLAFAYFTRDGDWNANSRLALVFAVVDEGTLQVDSYHAAEALATGDAALHAGHYYSEKALGTSLLGVAAYAPISDGSPLASPARLSFIRHWVTFFAVGLPLALACAFWVYVWSGVELSSYTVLSIASVALATPLFPFASLYFGHALAAALLLAALLLVCRVLLLDVAWTTASRLAFGACLGMAAITEFPVVPAALILAALYLYSCGRHGRLGTLSTWLLPAIAAAPFLLLQAAYDWKCFGSPWSLGYANLATPEFRSVHSHGLMGIVAPHLDRLFYITLHPMRGLFVQAPVLLLGLSGLCAGLASPRWRVVSGTCLLIATTQLLINAGFGMWWGGWSFTSRHALPAVPFLGMGLLFLPGRWRAWVAPLALVSFAQMLVAAAGDPLVSDDRLVDLLRVHGYLPLWSGSEIWQSAWPALLSNPDAWAQNAGNLIGLQGPASVLPLLAILFIGGVVAHRQLARLSRSRSVGDEPGGVDRRDPS